MNQLSPKGKRYLVIDTGKADRSVAWLFKYSKGRIDLTSYKELTEEEAKEYLAKYHNAYPQIANFHISAAQLAQKELEALPKENKQIVKSTKTGATWPKAKGAY